jgi:hypothetical protein
VQQVDARDPVNTVDFARCSLRRRAGEGSPG